MTTADLGFADTLCSIAGWNHTLDDWRRLLALEPTGCFTAENAGGAAGVATTTTYGNKVAWTGMLLVHPNARGQGIGTALLNHCLEWLRHRNVTCIKLDATPEGQSLYEKLGFRTEWPLARWERTVVPAGLHAESAASETESCECLQPARNPDAVRSMLDRIEAIDTRAFGVSRRKVLASMLAAAEFAAWLPPRADAEPQGYGLLRRGSRSYYIGSAVASPTTGIRVIKQLVRAASGSTLYWDIPDAQSEVISLAESLGFRRQRPYLRMHLGENIAPGRPSLQLGIADPAIG